jgi:hypothetical protein
MAVAAIGIAPAPSQAASDQLRDSAIRTYELQPARGVVHVTEALTLTNKAPSTAKHYSCTRYGIGPYGPVEYTITCTTRTDYYYNEHTLWVERDAKALKVKANSGSASVKLGGRDGDWRKVTIRYSPLYYGKTRKLTFSYDLPGGGPRSTAERRVGHAYSDFCAWGPGTETGSLRVVVPAGFDMRLTRSMSANTAGGKTTYSTPSMKQAWEFRSCVTGTNDAGYTSTPVRLADGRLVTIESWKEDTAWATAVRDAVTDDLPALKKLLGPAVDATDLVVREEVARVSAATYFTPLDSTLHLSESIADRAAATRSMSGLWFDRALFTESWMRNGYAAWAEHEAGVSAAPCSKPGAVPGAGDAALFQWKDAAPGSSNATLELAAYQGQAACYVVSTIAEAIGTDRMLDTIGAMRAGTDPFTGAVASTDVATAAVGWQTWLDIVVERGLVPAGADPGLADALAKTYGVTAADDVLAAHTHAIAAYHDLVAALGGPAPAAVTDALRTWEFEPAEAAIATAREVRETASSIDATLPGVATADGAVVTAILGAKTQADLDAAAVMADQQFELATAVADAIAMEHAPRDAIQELGLIGTTLPDDADAVAAVSRIDAAAAQSAVARIRAAIDGARDAGTQRLALALGGIVSLFLLVVGAVTVRRRRRRLAVAVRAFVERDPSTATALAPAAEAPAPAGEPLPPTPEPLVSAGREP